MDDVLTLLSYTRTQDATGIWRETLSSQRTVFCKVNSISRNEFYEGGRSGLNPEFEFVVAAVDYAGERECVYHGLSYSIYRTYRTNDDYMELYVQRKGGSNGKGSGIGQTVTGDQVNSQ